MTTIRKTERTRWISLLLPALLATGCAAQAVDLDQEPVASAEEAQSRGFGSPSAGYSCDSGGTCTCDKSIENDCEDMSGICTDGSVDALINCINGWLTTHCTCTKARVFVPTKTSVRPVGVVSATAAF